jgi:hypothetical protein
LIVLLRLSLSVRVDNRRCDVTITEDLQTSGKPPRGFGRAVPWILVAVTTVLFLIYVVAEVAPKLLPEAPAQSSYTSSSLLDLGFELSGTEKVEILGQTRDAEAWVKDTEPVIKVFVLDGREAALQTRGVICETPVEWWVATAVTVANIAAAQAEVQHGPDEVNVEYGGRDYIIHCRRV